jgi:hypothetical protein
LIELDEPPPTSFAFKYSIRTPGRVSSLLLVSSSLLALLLSCTLIFLKPTPHVALISSLALRLDYNAYRFICNMPDFKLSLSAKPPKPKARKKQVVVVSNAALSIYTPPVLISGVL